MADTLQFDLVSPERSLASLQASEVQLPGAEGDLTAMPDHAPLITTLRPGIVKAVASGATTEYAITGGFAEVSAEGARVLAELAMPVSEVTGDVMDKLVGDAEAAEAAAADGARDTAAKLVSDMQALRTALGV